MHHFLHILKYLYSQSKRKKYIRTIWLQKGIKKTTNLKNVDFARQNETIHHIIACCPKLSASMYLPVRHNKVAKVIYDTIINHNRILIEKIYTDNDKEIWWDKKVTTIPPLIHNKSDIV